MSSPCPDTREATPRRNDSIVPARACADQLGLFRGLEQANAAGVPSREDTRWLRQAGLPA